MYDDNHKMHIVEAGLRQDEKLLWTGQPSPYRMMLKDISRMIFGVFWTAVVLLIISALSGFDADELGSSAIATLLLGILLLIGLWLLATPLWNYVKATRTIYALTDQRALIVEQLFSPSVKAYTADDIEFIERRERDSNAGDLIFRIERDVSWTTSASGRSRMRIREIPVGFFGISGLREVGELMSEVFKPGDQGVA
ncbi:MAG: hypothetical protein JXB47_21420 [Anaerolineae bacterium]|nr:hypothetical protein [Anaerolineae bacterium]